MSNGKAGAPAKDITPLANPTARESLFNSRRAEYLNATAKDYRDAFVKSYLIDFKPTNAIIRIGHQNYKTATRAAQDLLHEPYVRCRIEEHLKQMRPEEVVSRTQVMAALWKEANTSGNLCSTRVAALAHIAKMLGMFMGDKQNGDGNNVNVNVAVMMVPATTPEDWAIAAPAAQAALKERASHALPEA
jgi:hypothetical protein